ncbi:hybrid sensor histidine kinase/response regulator transcription factor [Pseudotamlana carrageenivorans]|nr:hybrid sensor histidine kinase/response regulator transcription factor [Tamlana carrageenivorans]
MLYQRIIICLFLLIRISFINGQIKCKIEKYTTEDGLSHNGIRDIMKSKDGFMWFATWDGINRFDGTNFVTYKAKPGDGSTLGNNRIDMLEEDSSGNLWLIAYDEQIYRFEKSKEKFLSIAEIIGTNKITFDRIVPTKSGNVWLISENRGLFLAEENTESSIQISHYSKDSINGNAISSNYINFVYEYKKDSVWVGSRKGLDVLTKSEPYKFSSANIINGQNVRSFAETEEAIWFGTGEGHLVKWDKRTMVSQTTQLTNSIINAIEVSKISPDILYLTTAGGEFLTYNIITEKIGGRLKLSEKALHSIFEDKEGLIWVEPHKHGVFMVDPKSFKFSFFSQQNDASFLLIEQTYSVLEDLFGRVWVRLKGGGFGYYDQEKSAFEYFYNKPGDPNQKFSNIVSCMYLDNTCGGLWLSTKDRSINKIIFQKGSFEQQLVIPETKNKSENEIRALLTDSQKRVWIASKARKLHVFSGKKKVNLKDLFVNWPEDDIGLIYTMLEDSQSNIWLGSKGDGLYKAVPINNEKSKYELIHFKSNDSNANSLNSNLIYSILEDAQGRIWIGTFGGGITLIEQSEEGVRFINNFKNYPITASGRVRYLLTGYDDKIWVATTNGLLTFDPNTTDHQNIEFSKYVKKSDDGFSLGSNDVLFLYKDSENKMWVSAAGGGLSLVSQKESGRLKFKTYTKYDGLPSDFILSMIEDKEKNLWLATENGLSKFNLINQKFKNYDSNDGLVDTGFSESTNAMLPNGNLIFGCIKGYITFNPKDVEDNEIDVKMVFTNLEINNKNATISSDDFPLKKNINYEDNLLFDYKHSTIGINYTVLDYRSNNKQIYAYRLKGFNDEWQNVSNQRKATFTNLPPGDFTFEVKCMNDDLYSNMPSKSLAFTISPPFWKSNFAYFLYLILILILIEIARRIAYSMIRLRNKVVVEQKMTELKLSFFTNISHELRTPLTLIVNPIEEIAKYEKLSSVGNDYIETVRKNTNRLVRFVNQLLDFRKVQSGKEVLHVEEMEMISFLNELASLFAQTGSEKQIRVKIDSNFDALCVHLDKKKIDIVIYNLLSNAIKFSPHNSTIIINLDKDNHNILKIRVIDEGVGVEENKLQDIFKLYYETEMNQRHIEGTGIGLALCKEYIQLHQGEIYATNNEHGGLTVHIEIDLNNKIFNFDEKPNIVIPKPKTPKIEKSLTSEIETSDVENMTHAPLVLIVEDNDELRAFLRSQLRRFYRVVSASHGKEGLDLAIKKVPDLIISDVMMPVMDGIQFLEALKNTTETSHVPVILLTAKSSVESKIEGLNYGADYYITKPFDTEFLKASIENLISSRKKFFQTLQGNIKKIALEPSEIIITTKDEKFLKDIISIVEEGLSDPSFNINIIAKTIKMRRPTFNKKFKSLTGMTPVEFVRDMRLKRAKQFLDAGETDIADVAYKVGFNAAGYFSTCFKEVYNESPSDYVKNRNVN